MMMSFFCGAIIFPGVEVGKLWLTAKLGAAFVAKYRVISVLSTTAFVTFISSLAMIPWEIVKIRTMATTENLGNCFSVLGRILSEQGVLGLYVGFSALMTRNLVYMMSKFLVFDFFTDIVLRVFGRLPTNNFLLGVLSTIKGMIAGVFSVCVSHPPDAILTRMNQDAKSLGLVTAIQSIWETKGIAGFYAGVITRGLWAAGTVAMQFLIYDSVKALLFAALMLGIA